MMLLLLTLAAGPPAPQPPARFVAQSGLRSIAFLADNRLLAVGWDGKPYLWSREGRLLAAPDLGKEDVAALATTSDAKTVIFTGRGKFLAVGPAVKLLWQADAANEAQAVVGPGGKWVAAHFSERHDVILRSGKAGELVARLQRGHSRDVTLAADPVRHRVALLGRDGWLRVVEVFLDEVVWSAWGHARGSRPAGALAYHPRGEWLASGGQDGTVRLWSAADGKPLRALALGEAPCLALACSREGRVAASFADGTVAVFDGPSGRRLARYQTSHVIQSLAFSPDGETLAGASGTSNQTWCWVSGGERLLPRRDEPAPPVVGFFGGGMTGAPFRERYGREAQTLDGMLVASASEKKVTVTERGSGRRWDVAGGKSEVLSVSFDAAGRRLAVYRIDGLLEVWDVANRKRIFEVKSSPARLPGPAHLRFSPGGRHLLASTGGQQVLLLDLLEERETVLPVADPLRNLHAPGGIAWSPDGRLGVADGPFAVSWHPLRPGPARRWECGLKQAYDVAFSADGRLMCVCGSEPSFHFSIWEPASGQLVHRVSHPIGQTYRRAAFLPDGRLMAGTPSGESVLLWAPTPEGPGDDVARCWRRLPGPAADAHRAIAEMAARPASALPLLEKHLLPPAGPSAKRMRQLVLDLDDDDFDLRQSAEDELRRSLRASSTAMYRALRDGPPLEARRRLERLAAEWEASPEALVLDRAMTALERTGAAGRELMGRIAEAASGTPLGEGARAALARMTR
jgi:WD40 repeat protein